MQQSFDRALRLHKSGALKEAEAAYLDILRESPYDPEVLRQYGLLKGNQNEYEEAASLLRQSCAIQPTHAGGWCMYGAALGELTQYKESRCAYERALALGPDMPAARFNLALNQLYHGEWKEGWENYRWGAINRYFRTRRIEPEWNGEPILGKTLFVWADQGHGDTIMFLRFLKEAREVSGCARLIFEVQEPLLKIVSEAAEIDDLFIQTLDGSVPFPFDEHVSLISLPRVLGIDTPSKVSLEPYIIPYEARQPMPGKYNVGLCWQGNPSHANDKNRSMALADLAPLAELEGVRYHCLQLGVTKEEARKTFPEMFFYPIQDWSDTAHILAGLDAVVSVDTAVAHLAGAMGKPVHILLPFAPEWRWGAKWYREQFHFRQVKRKDWTQPVFEVKSVLQRLVSQEAQVSNGTL